MTGDAGGDTAAASLGVLRLLFAVGNSENFFQHALEFAPLQAYRSSLDGNRMRPEGFGLKAVSVKFIGQTRKGDHLRGQKIDQYRHEEALALNLLYLAGAEDLFEEDALVSDVLINDPEALVVDGEDKRVAKLAKRFERGQSVEGFVFIGRWRFVADGDLGLGKGEATGGFGNGLDSKAERRGVGRGWVGL